MESFLDDLIIRYPVLAQNKNDIIQTIDLLVKCVERGNKILICGNGGSSADADHIVGELMKGFALKRPLPDKLKETLTGIGGDLGTDMGHLLQSAIPAVSLSAQTALNTAIMNDIDPRYIFAQQVLGLGKPEDVLMAISTSGRSKNILCAAIAAKAGGLKIIALTGEKESPLADLSDVAIRVRGTEPYKIQELHLPVYHVICLILENHFFNSRGY